MDKSSCFETANPQREGNNLVDNYCVNPVRDEASNYRWLQLAIGVLCMVAVANIQYSWTLFVPTIQEMYGWPRASIQTAFTIFVLVQTWATPLLGAAIDRYGPRQVILLGGVAAALAWIANSYATTLTGFYVGAAIGAIAASSVNACCVNNALKWFPDRRGLAVGLTAAGYGAGAILRRFRSPR